MYRVSCPHGSNGNSLHGRPCSRMLLFLQLQHVNVEIRMVQVVFVSQAPNLNPETCRCDLTGVLLLGNLAKMRGGDRLKEFINAGSVVSCL